jgi:hypothetical protein
MELGLAQSRQGSVEASIDLSEAVPQGYVWSGPIRGNAQAWKLSSRDDLDQCGPGTWQRFATVPRVWREGSTKDEAHFQISSSVRQTLPAPGTYFVLAEAGTDDLAVPNPRAQWMRDWSIGSDEAIEFAGEQPQVFKALELSAFAELMEKELRNQVKDERVMRRFGFVLQVNR